MRALMWRHVGPFRDAAGLAAALARLREMRGMLPALAVTPGAHMNPTLADWFELRAGLLAAEAVAAAALARRESRGAHQRTDFPHADPALAGSHIVACEAAGTLTVKAAP
jgi:succinate dehydrogenase/fumarate reductase flavoprotein subunit